MSGFSKFHGNRYRRLFGLNEHWRRGAAPREMWIYPYNLNSFHPQYRNCFHICRELLTYTSGVFLKGYCALAKKSICLGVLFCKIKDTFFIFTNNFIDLGILSMLAISSLV